MSTVYVVHPDSSSRPMDRVRCKNEDKELQLLLEHNYNLLPGDQIDPEEPRRWLLIKREMPVPDPSTASDRWSIDFFFADQDAVPTLVECKRYADTRSRREVVGQMLEYAANGHHYWTKQALLDHAAKTAEAKGGTLDAALVAIAPTDERSADDFFALVQANLRSGQLRIIFFLEQAPHELRSVVDFLNKQMELSEVLLVEARQYEAGGQRVVVPMLFGYTEQARLAKWPLNTSISGGRRRWDKERFFSDASARLNRETLEAVEAVFEAGEAAGYETSWGTGTGKGSFNLKHPDLSQRSIVSVYSDGKACLHFGWLDDAPAVAARLVDLAVDHLGLERNACDGRHLILSPSDWVTKQRDLITILEQLPKEFSKRTS